jgi:PAS domain S-box-containing protein
VAGFGIVAGLLFVDFYQDAKETALRNLTQTQKIHARQAASGLQTFFSGWTRTLNALGGMDGVAQGDAAGKRALALFYQAHKEHVRSLTRVDENGTIIAAYPLESAAGTSIARQKHFIEVARYRRPVVSDVFRAVQGFDAVALHVPVFDGSRFRGSLAVVVNFESLARAYFDVIKIGQTSRALVISRDGTVLYSHVPALAGKSAFTVFEDRPAVMAVLRQMAKGREGTTTYQTVPIGYEGGAPTRLYGVYQPIHLGNTYWSVLIASSEAELLAGLNSFRNHLSVVIGLVFIGALLSAVIVVRARLLVKEERRRRAAENAFRKSEERLRSIIDATPNFIFSFDLGYRFMSANRAFCTALGTTEIDLVGRRFADTGIREEQPGLLRSLCEKVVATRKPVQFRASFILPGGETVTEEGTFSPLCDADGNVIAISGITLDVTEKIKVAQSLDRLSQAVAQASEVVLMTDRAGVITYVNPAFEAVYGYPESEAIGKTPRLLKSGRYTGADYERFWQSILAGKGVRDEVINRKADGSLVIVDRSVTPVLSDEHEIVGFLSVQTDITERKRLESEREALSLRMAELGKMEAIGTLAGGIAHDFNNILAVILSFAAVAEKSRNDESRFSSAFQTMRQAVRRGADLAKQVLTFARRAESTAEAIDLNALLAEITKMVQSSFPRTIRIDMALADSLPLVIADGTQLHQALLNLLINARDALPAGGTIRLATRVASATEVRRRFPDAADPAYVEVQVCDDGIGMSEEVRQRIFEPFFTTKSEGRGTGLGLAVAYGAVKSAGGFIGVESEKDHGTTFDVFLPLPQAGNASRGEGLGAAGELGGTETILFVEDEPELGPLMVESLRDRGYTPLLARDGLEALEIFETAASPIDIVVSDDGLPRLAGRDLFSAVRRRNPQMPFVLVSGLVDLETRDGLRRAGLNQFLQKPYTIDQLLAAIRVSLQVKSLAR